MPDSRPEIELNESEEEIVKSLAMSRGPDGTFYFCRDILNVRIPDGSGDCLSSQQHQATTAFDNIFLAKQKKATGLELTPEELILSRKLGVSVQAGKSTGKTGLECMLAIKTLVCYENAIVIFVGSSEDQVKETTWAQMTGFRSKSKIKDDIILKAESMYLSYETREIEMEKKKESFVCMKASGSDFKNLAGQHPKVLLYILTEATGISREACREIESTFGYKFGVSIMWLGYNPDRPVSYATETQTINRGQFACFQWNAEDSPLADPDFLAQRMKKHGRDSWEYKVYTLGELPESSSDSIVSWRQLQAAVNRELHPNPRSPLIFMIDPARGGGCECAMGMRQEWKFWPKIFGYDHDDTVELADMIAEDIIKIINDGITQELWDKDVEYYICVEMDGGGASLYDNINHHISGIGGSDEEHLVAVQMNRPAENRNQYERCKSKRDEYWRIVKTKFEKGVVQIPDDQKMIDQISGLTYSTDSGYWRAIPKKELKESPDRADLLAIGATLDISTPLSKPLYAKYFIDNQPEEENTELGWMTL